MSASTGEKKKKFLNWAVVQVGGQGRLKQADSLLFNKMIGSSVPFLNSSGKESIYYY